MGLVATYTCDICNKEYTESELHDLEFSMDSKSSTPIFLQKMICHDDLKIMLPHFTALGVSGGYLDVLKNEPA